MRCHADLGNRACRRHSGRAADARYPGHVQRVPVPRVRRRHRLQDGAEARNGGTIGRARLGYLNHIDRTDGREIRTIVIDLERAPLVRLGFELFVAGNLTLDQLSERLYQRGLRTRPTARRPAKRVSISKLARMLRDRYYLGYITYRDEELPGRHEPLVDQHLFDRVQAVLHARADTGERRRVHHHYLKGTLYCGHCHQAGTTGRMIIQHTVTRRGDEYTYFFCRNRQHGACRAPYVNVAVAEQAVERYYATISQQQIIDALATLTTLDTATVGKDLRKPTAPVQVYRSCTDNQRRILNHALFRQLYLADGRITSHQPWPTTPLT